MLHDPPVRSLQRARGRVEVALRRRDGATRLARLFQQGSAKAFLPRVEAPAPEVALVNTAGGVTGGDVFDYRLAVEDGAAMTATTQSAERVYRALGSLPARIGVEIAVGPGGRIDWLPRETILFDGGRLQRRLEADLAADARLTVLETLALGRAAMGETVRAGEYRDLWRIRREGRLVHAEAFRLEEGLMGEDLGRAAAGPAALAGARAMATLVHAAPDAELRLAPARAALAETTAAGSAGVEAAASLKPGGVLVVRWIAPDLAPLRAALAAFLIAFRGAPPRVWSL